MSPGDELLFTPAEGGLTFMVTPIVRFRGRAASARSWWPAPVLLLMVLLAAPSRARVWQVDPGGAGDAPTIQAAIDAAADGDTIDLAPGFYRENCAIVNKTLLVRGAGIELTEIGAAAPGHVLALRGPANYTEIRDLTLADGSANALGDPLGGTTGGGLLGEQARFALVRCRFLRCSAGGLGGGLYATLIPFDPGGARSLAPPTAPPDRATAAPRPAIVIEECIFDGGFAGSEGGNLALESTQFIIERCTFRNGFSVQGAGVSILDSIGWIRGCLFETNEALQDGGGLKLDNRVGFETAALVVEENSFVGNRADRFGAGVALADGQGMLVRRNLFTGQAGPASAVIGCMLPVSAYAGGCNHFWSNAQPSLSGCAPLADDTEGDPLFCDAAGADWRLCQASPLLSRACGPAGAFAVGCGGAACALPARPITWSGLKTLLR